MQRLLGVMIDLFFVALLINALLIIVGWLFVPVLAPRPVWNVWLAALMLRTFIVLLPLMALAVLVNALLVPEPPEPRDSLPPSYPSEPQAPADTMQPTT
ncbi:MAG: hypothetical protein GYB65_18690 [Chloroflexi bacterium]|nr:hypothetical protein [Chloroflexota bacterium]